MIRKLISLGGVLAVGLLLAGAQGCGDDKPEVQPVAEPYPDYPAFCNGIAQAQCTAAIQQRCSLTNVSNDACVGEVSRSCVNKDNDVTRDIQSTGDYRKDKADACIKAVEAVYAKPDGTITSADHKTLRDACDPVFRGHTIAGLECTADRECDDGLVCYRKDLDAAKGTCETLSTKVLVKGDDCQGKGEICPATTYCSPTDKICGGRPDIGKECAANRPCLETYSCVNIDATSGKGTCGVKKISNDACLSDAECQSGFCALVGDLKICLDVLNFGTGSPVCKNFDGQ